jgi:hypothetical protein
MAQNYESNQINVPIAIRTTTVLLIPPLLPAVFPATDRISAIYLSSA